MESIFDQPTKQMYSTQHIKRPLPTFQEQQPGRTRQSASSSNNISVPPPLPVGRGIRLR
ncbi:uncharacterized protein LY79DRAFT_538579 [Colletotrichum navitas]|uniref:Uncharacterized protein n=1 Tax=Colletotrichum navitas TaxID=681940 RepID=A0AAD8Q9T4_9PEZI|nr:uncharacterized protein LY79DRAFT_538579 [Colletotrichum navitas]KAK1598239.1 hypothetical protein LY79DRAFT_538579 [Colletotrichum navitas]